MTGRQAEVCVLAGIALVLVVVAYLRLFHPRVIGTQYIIHSNDTKPHPMFQDVKPPREMHPSDFR